MSAELGRDQGAFCFAGGDGDMTTRSSKERPSHGICDRDRLTESRILVLLITHQQSIANIMAIHFSILVVIVFVFCGEYMCALFVSYMVAKMRQCCVS